MCVSSDWTLILWLTSVTDRRNGIGPTPFFFALLLAVAVESGVSEKMSRIVVGVVHRLKHLEESLESLARLSPPEKLSCVFGPRKTNDLRGVPLRWASRESLASSESSPKASFRIPSIEFPILKFVLIFFCGWGVSF